MKKLIPLIIFGFSFAIFSFGPSSEEEKADVMNTPLKKALVIWTINDAVRPESYPGYDIKLRSFSDEEEYYSVLKNNLGKGKGPDIFFINAARKAEFDSLESLPYKVDPLKIFYNQRYFPEGIADTWVSFAEQMRGIKIAGIAMGRLDNTKYGGDLLKALLLQKGLEKKDEAISFFKRFANPNDRYFNWNENLNKNYPDQEIDSFVKEKIAAVAAYASDLPWIQKKIEEVSVSKRPHLRSADLRETPLPQFDIKNPKYQARIMMAAVSKSSRNPEKSTELLRLMTKDVKDALGAEDLILDVGL